MVPALRQSCILFMSKLLLLFSVWIAGLTIESLPGNLSASLSLPFTHFSHNHCSSFCNLHLLKTHIERHWIFLCVKKVAPITKKSETKKILEQNPSCVMGFLSPVTCNLLPMATVTAPHPPPAKSNSPTMAGFPTYLSTKKNLQQKKVSEFSSFSDTLFDQKSRGNTVQGSPGGGK